MLDRLTTPTDFGDQDLWVQFMSEDRELGYGDPDDDRHQALHAEIGRRFGRDATERTAEWATATHMSSDDIVTWASEHYDHLNRVALGKVCLYCNGPHDGYTTPC